jgi:hypothetical protein
MATLKPELLNIKHVVLLITDGSDLFGRHANMWREISRDRAFIRRLSLTWRYTVR